MIADIEWARDVAKELIHIFESGKKLIEDDASLERVVVEPGPDGVPILCVWYRRADYPMKFGMRQRLLKPDAPHASLTDPADMADWIANFDLAEPLGSRYYDLREDSVGVFWWGDAVPNESSKEA